MFSFFNHRPRPIPVPGPPGPQGPMGPPGQDGADGTTHVNLHYPAPVFHRVATAPEDHPAPVRAHAGDAGHDLHAAQGGVIPVGQRRAISVGYSVELDPQTYGKLEGRSSLARDCGLLVLGGVIDSGYTGELVVILHNAGDRSWSYSAGDRVAQLVVSPVVTGGAFHVDGERGSAGFGSTGQGASSKESKALHLEGEEDVAVLQPDMVNHPPHYTGHPIFPGECWDYAQHMAYGQGAAFKYLWRAEGKDTVASNLDKAHWYLASGGLAREGLEWTSLEDHGDLATLLTDAVVDAERVVTEATAGQLLTATAAAYVSLGDPEAALGYVHRALEWYQFPGNV